MLCVFRFICGLQSSLKQHTELSAAFNRPAQKMDMSASDYTTSSTFESSSDGKDSILSFLERLADNTDDMMPESHK